MHTITSTAPRARRLAFLALLGTLLLLALAAPALAAQRPDYTGGPVTANADGKADFPLYVPNDYTVNALRFSVTGGTLYDVDNNPVTTAGVEYYVKIRLSPAVAPAGSDNRGFTWNPTTQTWVQERSDWASFPVATTGAGGAIAAGSTWYYFRFADTAKAGTYYILISLQPVGGGSGTTQNNSSVPAVTVLDSAGTIDGATDGFVVHNGVAAAASKGKRADATQSGAATTVWALSRAADTATTMPLQLAPDLWTGANATDGDFALGVPVGSAFDARLQNTIWPTGAPSFTGSLADVNVALGAAETTPPSAPGVVSGESRNAGAELTWAAATDDTAVTSYIVYRWTDAPLGSGYSAMPSGDRHRHRRDDLRRLRPRQRHDLPLPRACRRRGDQHRAALDDRRRDARRHRTGARDELHRDPGRRPHQAGLDQPGRRRSRGNQDPPQGERATCRPDRRDRGLRRRGTSFDDTDVTNGEEYYYAVYAYDAAFNYSTAATASDVVPDGSVTITIGATPAIVNWGKPWTLNGRLKNADGAALPDALVDLEASIDGGTVWATLESVTPQAGTSTYSQSFAAPDRKTMYRLYYAGDATHSDAYSGPVTVTPRVKLGTPVAPSVVKKKANFTAYGSLTPKQPAGSKTVEIKCYLKKNGKWLLKKTVMATNSNSRSASRYTAKFSLAYAGLWKLVAVSPATAKYAQTTSGSEFLRVR